METALPQPPAENERGGRIVVAVGHGSEAQRLVRSGKRFADALHLGWDAVHVATPEHEQESKDSSALAESLALAARLGGSVATVPAASVADGLGLFLADSPADQLVLGRSGRRTFLRPSLADTMIRRCPRLTLHLIPEPDHPTRPGPTLPAIAPPRGFLFATAAVLLTLVVAIILNRAAGVRSLSFLFLFPVIAAAARRGIAASVAAALLSALVFNIFFLKPVYSLQLSNIQSWLMAVVLVAVAIYTGALTTTLRGRIALSERSARENARIASFALDLTRAADWNGTARIICSQISAIFNVHTLLSREIDGQFHTIAATPADVRLETLDAAALDWTWTRGEATGSGTPVLSATNWQFQPLKTSLGTLAVLGLARDDGRDPVPPERALLLSTLTAQAALALERLHLEDRMANGNGAPTE